MEGRSHIETLRNHASRVEGVYKTAAPLTMLENVPAFGSVVKLKGFTTSLRSCMEKLRSSFALSRAPRLASMSAQACVIGTVTPGRVSVRRTL